MSAINKLTGAQPLKVVEAAKVIESTPRDLNIALINEPSMKFDLMGVATGAILILFNLTV